MVGPACFRARQRHVGFYSFEIVNNCLQGLDGINCCLMLLCVTIGGLVELFECFAASVCPLEDIEHIARGGESRDRFHFEHL